MLSTEFQAIVRIKPGNKIAAKGGWKSGEHFDNPQEVAALIKDDADCRGVLEGLLDQIKQRVHTSPAASFCDA